MEDSYHNRPEWSYSQMKVILDSGIDYAVAAKRGMLPKPASKSIDLGQLAHMYCLGGSPYIFALNPYDSFRTNEAKAWKTKQEELGKYIITHGEYDIIDKIVDNIVAHPISKKLLKGRDVKHEMEMYGQINGLKLRGKADAILIEMGSGVTITDIKTTAQFDKWKYQAMKRHYDLQAALYSLLAANSLGFEQNRVKFYFCVAETVAPYRVQYHFADTVFLESGERKLGKCIEEIEKFGDKEPNFLIEEVNELGDWSL